MAVDGPAGALEQPQAIQSPNTGDAVRNSDR